MGDVKLVAVMGFFLGRAVAPALLIGFAVGVIAGIGIMLARGVDARKQAIRLRRISHSAASWASSSART